MSDLETRTGDYLVCTSMISNTFLLFFLLLFLLLSVTCLVCTPKSTAQDELLRNSRPSRVFLPLELCWRVLFFSFHFFSFSQHGQVVHHRHPDRSDERGADRSERCYARRCASRRVSGGNHLGEFDSQDNEYRYFLIFSFCFIPVFVVCYLFAPCRFWSRVLS